MMKDFSGWAAAGAIGVTIECLRQPYMSRWHEEAKKLADNLAAHGRLTPAEMGSLHCLYTGVAVWGRNARPLRWPCTEFDETAEMFALIRLYDSVSLTVLTVAGLLGFQNAERLLDLPGNCPTGDNRPVWQAFLNVARMKWTARKSANGKRRVCANRDEEFLRLHEVEKKSAKVISTDWNNEHPDDTATPGAVTKAWQRARKERDKELFSDK